MPAAFLNTFLSLCSCPLSSPNFWECCPWVCSLCQEAMPSQLLLQVSLTLFFSSLTSLRSSCHITDTHHKTDQKNPNKAKNNTGPSKVLAVITFIQSEPLLPTHALSIDTTSSLSTGTICYEVFAHCLAQKGPPVIASFLYSKEPVPGRCTIFNAAHPRETYILSFFLCFLTNKTSHCNCRHNSHN